MYIMTVVQYGHPELLEFVPDSLNAAILLSGLVGPLQQVRVFVILSDQISHPTHRDGSPTGCIDSAIRVTSRCSACFFLHAVPGDLSRLER